MWEAVKPVLGEEGELDEKRLVEGKSGNSNWVVWEAERPVVEGEGELDEKRLVEGKS